MSIPALDEPIAWYYAAISPQRELSAEHILRRRGFQTFLPLRREWRRPNKYRQKKRGVLYAQTPGRIFVGLAPQQTFYELIVAAGVVRGVLMADGRPRRLTEKEMVKAREMGRAAPSAWRFMRTHAEFLEGDFARIVSGPFRDRDIRVDRIDEETGRARFTESILGGNHEIWVPLDALEKAA